MKRLLLAFCSIPMLALAADGPAIFSDDFETRGLYAEKWTASRGLLPQNGVVILGPGQSIATRTDLTGKPFAVEADLTFHSTKGGHAGINLDGIHFMVQNGNKGWNTAYRPKGMKRSLGRAGQIPGFTYGETVRWRITREPFGEQTKYTLAVNGKILHSFMATMEQSKTVSFYSYRSKMSVDNVQINSIIQGEASPNSVINSSFEHLMDGMPPYFNAQTFRTVKWNNYEKSFDTFTIDTKEKHSGKQSLRLTVTPDVPVNGVLTFPVSCIIGKPVTGSFWAKASKPARATANFWEQHHKCHSKYIELTTEWKRYSITCEKPERSLICLGLNSKEQGLIFWVDDFQVESGTKVSPWKLSSLDAEKFSNTKTQVYEPPQYTLPVAAKSPVVDGDLTDLIALKPLKIDRFYWRGKEYKGPNKTTVWFLFANNTLFIGARAKVEKLSAVKKVKAGRDHMNNFNGDCLEIFVDGDLSQKKYLQLCVNSSGDVTDLGYGRNIKWNGKWKAAVRENQKESSIDYEVAIPLTDLATPQISDVWGINIGRSCNVCLNMLPFKADNYHKVDRYAKFRLPAAPVAEIRKTAATAAKGQKKAADVYFLRTFYMKENSAQLVGEINLPNPESCKIEFTIAGQTFKFTPKSSDFEFSIPLAKIPLGDTKGVFQLKKGNRTVYTAPVTLRKLAYHPQNTPIDRRVRAIIVDGKPRIIVAPFTGIPNDPKEIEALVNVITNAGLKYWMPGVHTPNKSLDTFTKLCEKKNIRLITWFFRAWKDRSKNNWNQYFASVSSPSIIGFLMVDEPELYAKSDEVRDYMRNLRRIMQRVPVMMNNTRLGIPSRFADLETDVFGIDDYLTNSETRTVQEMYDVAKSIEQACRDGRKPGFFFLSGGNLHNHYREPTYQEQIAESYAAITAGLTVVSYFAGNPAWRCDWEGIKDFNKEMLVLNDIILSHEKITEATTTNPAIKYLIRKLNGKVYVIALNPTTETQKVSFTIPAKGTSAKVYFEKRSLSVRNGIINDIFKPLERHIYEIKER